MGDLPETKRSLLIVDDEEDTDKAMKDILERAGHIVDYVTTGLEAISKAQERLFDLIFLDVHLPDTSSLGVFRGIKKHNPKIKICLMTGWPRGVETDREDYLKMIDEGAIDVMLRKPFGREEVLRAVTKILGEDLRNA